MKKLLITEEEKSRILGMHKKAILREFSPDEKIKTNLQYRRCDGEYGNVENGSYESIKIEKVEGDFIKFIKEPAVSPDDKTQPIYKCLGGGSEPGIGDSILVGRCFKVENYDNIKSVDGGTEVNCQTGDA